MIPMIKGEKTSVILRVHRITILENTIIMKDMFYKVYLYSSFNCLVQYYLIPLIDIFYIETEKCANRFVVLAMACMLYFTGIKSSHFFSMVFHEDASGRHRG